MKYPIAMRFFAVWIVAGLSVAHSAWAQDSPSGWVDRAQFTRAIKQREPVDRVVQFDTREQSIYYFTELRGLAGQRVLHRWEYQGQVMAEVPFEVKGPRWRVFSRKSLLPTQTGKWTVVVVDENGWALRASVFEYRTAPPEQKAVSVDKPPPSSAPVATEKPVLGEALAQPVSVEPESALQPEPAPELPVPLEPESAPQIAVPAAGPREKAQISPPPANGQPALSE